MQNPHELLDLDIALRPQNITSATTTTGDTIDTKGARELLLVIQLGAYTAGTLSAAVIQWFHGEENDLGDEAQLGSSVSFFSSIAAGAKLYVRVRSADGKKFGRAKVVTTGAPTALNIGVLAIAADGPVKPARTAAGAALTLLGTING